MHVALIGMSNIGKTYWAQRLADELGFEPVDCDQLIERKLGTELEKLGYAGIRDVARWMGQPFDPQYPDTSRKYIAYERTAMQETMARVHDAPPGKSFAIATTGSVIYVGDDIAEQLQALTRIVYLEASPEHAAQLFERYMAEPKPVVWGSAFAPQNNETPQETLRRCYPELLNSRARRYREIAHITIPFEKHKMPNADLRSLIEIP